VQGSTIEAKDYLDQAEEFSRKYNLAHMRQLVQDTQKQFDLNFKKWSDLTNSSQSLKERMQEIQLKHYMDLAMELRSTIDDI
ncbi:MAG: hypothetical protein IH840_09325, partial [Candidatus Heimdallarchaeota archaeon]|nr:hypothetical protein [Candidatus Heimdallarchaeota archaeon]